MLSNKRINLNEDFSGVNFQLYKNGETIELYPEDLSHGELKRLSIYIWLKSRNIKNAIVLMDEVEIAFHPDWQYQIISDLKEWAPSNQYILATHSYALCEALTPAHVKEIEPKLIKQESNITNES
jgi:predicted ATPase